ncbi:MULTISPECIES: hypothetical protein [unclassified Streptomyces]|uniref:hypothetical protein n=1 Tax=unclassified Streptomyces TaxID=2593676 RepID=UPI0037F39124
MVLAQLVSADSAQDITPAVPALLVAANDSYDRVAGPAAVALARLGHPGVLDPVHRWLAASSRLPFFYVTSLGQVLQPLLTRADELLPGIRRVLAGFVRGDAQPPRHDGSTLLPNGIRRWHGAQNAAWAHWRITGGPEVFLAFAQDAAARGLGYADLARLAELGPLATRCATAVRPLLQSPGPWTRVQAAHAWWRITGDTSAAVPVLLAALEPLRSGDADEPCRAAVRYVARIGAPASAAAPLLEAALSSDRSFPADVYPAARAALAAFSDGLRPQPGRSRPETSPPEQATGRA